MVAKEKKAVEQEEEQEDFQNQVDAAYFLLHECSDFDHEQSWRMRV